MQQPFAEMERIVLVEAEEEHVHITVELQDGYRKYYGFPVWIIKLCNLQKIKPQKPHNKLFAVLTSDSEAIRTLDPRLRRALLYPAELRNHP